MEVGDIFRRIEKVEADIAKLQVREDQEGSLQKSMMGELRGRLSEHHSLLRQQEILWRQKFRVQWIQEGDQNIRFLHHSTMIRRPTNRIRQLGRSDSSVVDDSRKIRGEIFQFFRDRWMVSLGENYPISNLY